MVGAMPRAPLVACVGEALWDLPARGGESLSEARFVGLEPGGAAVLVALRLARAGVSVGLAASVGADPLGRALRDRVAAAGVDVRSVALVAARTPLLFVGAAPDGGRELVGYRRPEEEAIIAPRPGSRLVHLAAASPVPAHARALDAIARAARRRKAIVTLDLNARPRLWRHVKWTRLAAVDTADVVKCSAEDLEVLGLGEGIRAVAALRARMRPEATLVVTRGAGVITAHGPFGVLEHAVRPLRRAEPTGAGDALMAGVIAAIVGKTARARGTEALFAEAITQGVAWARERLRR